MSLAKLYPKVRVELAFGADPTADPSGWSWTDVGKIPDQTLSIRRGRADESSEPSPSQVTVELYNQDGAFTPTDPRSPHYPNVRRGTPVRVSARLLDTDPWDVRFVGQVSEWAPSWPRGDISDHDHPTERPGEARVTIVCNGILRRLGQGQKALGSALRRYLSTDPEVLVYWPMEDGPLTDGPFSPTGGRPLGVTGGFTWASDDSLPGSKSLPGIGKDAYWAGRVTSGGHITDWVAHVLVRLPELSAAATPVLLVWLNGGRIRVTVSSTQIGIERQENEGAWTPETPVDLTAVPTAGWMRVTLDSRFAGSQYLATLSRAGNSSDLLGQVGTNLAAASGNLALAAVGGRVTAPPNGMAVGHLTVGLYPGSPSSPGIPPGVDGSDDAELGWTGETAAARITRICAEENIDLDVVGAATNSTPMGAQRPATLLELVTQCAASESGILGEQIARPGLTFRTRWDRYNRPVDLTVDASADEIDAPFEPAYDDQRLRNDVTVTRDGGSSAQVVDEDSIDDEGTYDETVTLLLAADSQARHHAAWRLHLGTWDTMRYPAISTSLDTAPAAVLDLGLGDRVQVTDLPPQHPTDAVDVLVEGMTETIGQDVWRIEANCSPAGPWDVWRVGDDVGSAPLAL